MNASVAPGVPTAAGRGLAGALLAWWHSRTAGPARQLRLVETLPLGPKRSVALFELGGQRFLAGMGADGVQTLLQVSTATDPSKTPATDPSKTPAAALQDVRP